MDPQLLLYIKWYKNVVFFREKRLWYNDNKLEIFLLSPFFKQIGCWKRETKKSSKQTWKLLDYSLCICFRSSVKFIETPKLYALVKLTHVIHASMSQWSIVVEKSSSGELPCTCIIWRYWLLYVIVINRFDVTFQYILCS